MNLSPNRRGAFTTALKSLAGASLVTALVPKVPAAFAESASGPSPADTSPDTQFTVFIMPDGLMGPDGKMHDAILPTNFVVSAGVPTVLKFVNFDGGTHSIVSDDLGLDIDVAAGTKDASGARVPTVTTATITVPAKGTYRWDCDLTCDGGADHWAMSAGFGGDSQEGYMAGRIVAL